MINDTWVEHLTGNKQVAPKISIIIPSRNRSKYIYELIHDIREQSIEAFEVIIVDQSEIPYELDQGTDLIHILDNGMGPCRARNLGIERARGDIIVFLDDDIRIEYDFLKELCSPIINGNHIAVCGANCNYLGEYPKSEWKIWKKDTPWWIDALTANPNTIGRGVTLSFPTGCAAISKIVLDEVGNFDLFFDPNGAGEDREMALRIYTHGYPIFYNGKAYIKHFGAQEGGRRSVFWDNELNILECNYVYIIGKYFSRRIWEAHCRTWRRMTFFRYLEWNPRSWVRATRQFLRTGKWIKQVKEELFNKKVS